MVIAAVALTVAIDLKRSGTYRPGFVKTLFQFFAASLVNRHSSVLWVLPTVLICTGMWSCHAAGGFIFTATLITSGYAIILTNMGSLELCFRTTTFCVWLSYQGCNGSLNVIEARFRSIFLRGVSKREHDWA